MSSEYGGKWTSEVKDAADKYKERYGRLLPGSAAFRAEEVEQIFLRLVKTRLETETVIAERVKALGYLDKVKPVSWGRTVGMLYKKFKDEQTRARLQLDQLELLIQAKFDTSTAKPREERASQVAENTRPKSSDESNDDVVRELELSLQTETPEERLEHISQEITKMLTDSPMRRVEQGVTKDSFREGLRDAALYPSPPNDSRFREVASRVLEHARVLEQVVTSQASSQVQFKHRIIRDDYDEESDDEGNAMVDKGDKSEHSVQPSDDGIIEMHDEVPAGDNGSQMDDDDDAAGDNGSQMDDDDDAAGQDGVHMDEDNPDHVTDDDMEQDEGDALEIPEHIREQVEARMDEVFQEYNFANIIKYVKMHALKCSDNVFKNVMLEVLTHYLDGTYVDRKIKGVIMGVLMDCELNQEPVSEKGSGKKKSDKRKNKPELPEVVDPERTTILQIIDIYLARANMKTKKACISFMSAGTVNSARDHYSNIFRYLSNIETLCKYKEHIESQSIELRDIRELEKIDLQHLPWTEPLHIGDMVCAKVQLILQEKGVGTTKERKYFTLKNYNYPCIVLDPDGVMFSQGMKISCSPQDDFGVPTSHLRNTPCDSLGEDTPFIKAITFSFSSFKKGSVFMQQVKPTDYQEVYIRPVDLTIPTYNNSFAHGGMRFMNPQQPNIENYSSLHFVLNTLSAAMCTDADKSYKYPDVLIPAIRSVLPFIREKFGLLSYFGQLELLVLLFYRFFRKHPKEVSFPDRF